MTRSLLVGLAAIVAVAVLSGTGCQSTGVGDPCTPEQEYDPSFLGFDIGEVSVESKSFQCQTRLCLVNHFEGRVSCPYGQQANGMPVAGTTACDSQGAGCCTPGVNAPVTGLEPDGTFSDPVNMAKVPAQCSNRQAADAVYCSCRCANVNNQTNDGFNYCTCPNGFACTQLVNSIGGNSDEGLTGAYCVKDNTAYNPTETTCTSCDPTTQYCGSKQGVTAGH
jgi:hypothetical protein